jgi:dienelactone hydrolase
MMRGPLLAVLIVAAAMQPALASEFHFEDLRIPMAAAGPGGLEAALLRPAGNGRYPLALISHGTSRDADVRRDIVPYGFYRQAIEFARRGFAALVVLRRGYGGGGGEYAERNSCCDSGPLLRAARTSATDLRVAIAAMKNRADVDTHGMIAIGVSTGGFATIALASDPPPGLAAAINFAGGLHRASLTGTGIRNERDETSLVSVFRSFGKTSRIPMLWVYAENDSFFRPDLAHRLFDAFTAAGGRAKLIDAPAFGTDGHSLFSAGIAVWPAMVDDFLREHNLGTRELLAPPTLPAPPRLGEKGRTAFAEYLASGPHKAFAVSPRGAFGFHTGRRSASDAVNAALAGCGKHASDCVLYAIDDELAEKAAAGSR